MTFEGPVDGFGGVTLRPAVTAGGSAARGVAVTPKPARAAVLDAARDAVVRDRAATHGQPENSFAMIAASWSARLGVTVTPAQVCILLSDVKSCRAWGNPGHADNWIDLAGYAACGGEVSGAVIPGGDA